MKYLFGILLLFNALTASVFGASKNPPLVEINKKEDAFYKKIKKHEETKIKNCYREYVKTLKAYAKISKEMDKNTATPPEEKEAVRKRKEAFITLQGWRNPKPVKKKRGKKEAPADDLFSQVPPPSVTGLPKGETNVRLDQEGDRQVLSFILPAEKYCAITIEQRVPSVEDDMVIEFEIRNNVSNFNSWSIGFRFTDAEGHESSNMIPINQHLHFENGRLKFRVRGKVFNEHKAYWWDAKTKKSVETPWLKDKIKNIYFAASGRKNSERIEIINFRIH